MTRVIVEVTYEDNSCDFWLGAEGEENELLEKAKDTAAREQGRFGRVKSIVVKKGAAS